MARSENERSEATDIAAEPVPIINQDDNGQTQRRGQLPSKASATDHEAPFVAVRDDDHRRVEVRHPAGTAEAGLDLTGFDSAATFRQFLDTHHLAGPYPVPRHPSRRQPDVEAGALKGWAWADEYVVVVTGANPLTGVRAGIRRHPEPGYASYIGIKGDRSSVATMFYALRRRASVCKGADSMQSYLK